MREHRDFRHAETQAKSASRRPARALLTALSMRRAANGVLS
jgi:hypothetical protein